MKRLGLTILSLPILALTSCGVDGEPPVKAYDPQSLLEAFQALKEAPSYALSVEKKGEYLESYVYSNGYFASYKEGEESSTLYSYVEDEGGIFTYEAYGAKYVSSPYLTDGDGALEKDLLSIYSDRYFTGKDYSFLSEMTSETEALEITNKTFRIDILRSIGLKASDIVSFSSVSASFKEGVLSLEATLGNDAYKIDVSSFGEASVEAVEAYLASGGSALALSGTIASFKTLICLNDYVSDTYDMNEGAYVAYEVFNPHYFLSQYLSSEYGSGLLEITNSSTLAKGSYLFVAQGTLENGYSSLSVTTSAPYSEEEVEVAYHYPSYLKVVSSPQYLIEESKGLSLSGYTFKGEVYSFNEKSLLLDFASNFSLDQTWDVSTYVPSRVYIDIVLGETDASSEVTFVYCFSDGSYSYVYPIHFRDFGASSISMLDKAYSVYNV